MLESVAVIQFTKGQGLSIDQFTKLDIPTDGWSKLNPKILSEYIVKIVFNTTPIFLSDKSQSEPIHYAAERIHNAIKQMDEGQPLLTYSNS